LEEEDEKAENKEEAEEFCKNQAPREALPSLSCLQ
jgi:hypothetical protein